MDPLAQQSLRAANALASDVDPATAPKAISACYYAMFHAIGAAAVETLVAFEPTRWRVRRTIKHEDLRRKARHLAQAHPESKQWKSSPMPGFDEVPSDELKAICSVVSELYSKRILADYRGGMTVEPHSVRRETIPEVERAMGSSTG